MLDVPTRSYIRLPVLRDEPAVLGLTPPIRVPAGDPLLQEVAVIHHPMLDIIPIRGNIDRILISPRTNKSTILGTATRIYVSVWRHIRRVVLGEETAILGLTPP